VDTSAPQILGTWLLRRVRERTVLRRFAHSKNLWEQRIAIIATQALIRDGQFDDTLHLSEHFLTHPHDLMHKACGWMLREIGDRDEAVLRRFLDQHAARMPRTMLRYSIEKLPEAERKGYLLGTK
jgi:3-methyladenine DNA glycosylase AlkD